MNGNLYSEKGRYERKFIADTIDIRTVEQIIKLHPNLFAEIHSQRYINNIYFDSPSLENYYDNLFGKSQRNKARIRWYGDLLGEIKKPVLEIKIKNGNLGNKLAFPLHPFLFEKNFDTKTLSEILKKSELPQNIYTKISHAIPTLINRYSRKYFTDFSRNYRITTDIELKYLRINPGRNILTELISDLQNIIIELKYNYEHDYKAIEITGKLPFRLTKNSKYVNGIEIFNNTGV